jgi:hypothetical protein
VKGFVRELDGRAVLVGIEFLQQIRQPGVDRVTVGDEFVRLRVGRIVDPRGRDVPRGTFCWGGLKTGNVPRGTLRCSSHFGANSGTVRA